MLLLLLHVGDGGYSALHSGTVTQLVGGGQKAGTDAGVDMSGTPGLAAMTGVCVCVRACMRACTCMDLHACSSVQIHTHPSG